MRALIKNWFKRSSIFGLIFLQLSCDSGADFTKRVLRTDSASFAGRVLRNDAIPVEGADVIFGVVKSDEAGNPVSFKLLRKVETGSKGLFELPVGSKEISGEYLLTINKGGFKAERIKITAREIDKFKGAFGSYVVFLKRE